MTPKKVHPILFLCLCCWALPIKGQVSADELATLIKDCQANGRNASLMSEYTYYWKIRQRGTSKSGAFKDEFSMYETYVPTLKSKGSTKFVLIQTHEKSQPLPPDKVEKERQKAGERLAKAETEIQEKKTSARATAEDEKQKGLPGIYFEANVNFGLAKSVKLSPQTILKQCAFENLREELLNGRPSFKLDFRPATSAVFEKDEKFLAQAQGTIWIDQADRIVVKIEGRKLTAKPNDELFFLYQSIRVPEGKWLPAQVQFNGTKDKEFFNGMNGDMIFEWLDYKRFVTDAEDAKLKSPK